MVRVRLANQPKDPPDRRDGPADRAPIVPEEPRRHREERARREYAGEPPPKRAQTAHAAASSGRGLTERQWTISLLVVSGLLLLLTFRGCVLPSGVGPKSKPAAQTTATPQPAATTAPAGQEYTVRGGDTLSSIAQQFNTTVDALILTNNINRGTPLRVGQKLKLPAGNVQSGSPTGPINAQP